MAIFLAYQQEKYEDPRLLGVCSTRTAARKLCRERYGESEGNEDYYIEVWEVDYGRLEFINLTGRLGSHEQAAALRFSPFRTEL